MKPQKILKALLFPHFAVIALLLPASAAFLVYSMVYTETNSVTAIISYVLSAYTLTVTFLKIPSTICFFKRFKNENKYAKRWLTDTRFRVNLSLLCSSLWNTAYAFFQLGLGIRHRTFWFYSLAGYYFSLAVMRIYLSRYTVKHTPRENMLDELKKYSTCGIVFLITNLALTLIVFFMVYWNRTFVHREITTITMAAYTFTSFTIAIINTVKYRKFGSPVYSASKAISLAAACVSMLTLESTMLTAFGDETIGLTERRLFLGISGGMISAFILIMAVYMIVRGTKSIKKLNSTKEQKNNG